MKLELKVLEKAIDTIKKSGASQVDVDFVARQGGKLEFKYCGLDDFTTMITLSPANSDLFNEITKTERF